MGGNHITSPRRITATALECTTCRQLKPDKNFSKDKNSIRYRGRSYICKPCASTKSKKYHNDRKGDPAYIAARRSGHIKRTHGITANEYAEKLGKQGSKCAICQVKLLPSGYGTHLDHCHNTGKLREFLCTNCNRGLGHFQDSIPNLIKAAWYLHRHRAECSSAKGG